jgi:hypothetical protein
LGYRQLFFKNIFASVMGVLGGMIIYSGFPLNIYSLMKNIINVQTNATGEISPVGGEVFAKDFMNDFVFHFELFSLLAFIGIVVTMYFYINIRNKKITNNKLNQNNRLIFLYTFFIFLIVTISGTLIFSGRFFDYYIPASVFLFAVIITILYEKKYFIIREDLQKVFFVVLFLFVLLLCLGSFLMMRRTFATFDNYKFEQAANWIEKKSIEKEKVYLNRWGHFTPLFFYNDKNVYSMGLEPNDALHANPVLYWKWQNFGKNLFYCEYEKNCNKEAKQFFDMANKLNQEKRKKVYKINSNKIINSISMDFDAQFIVSDSKHFNEMLHYNDEMFIDNFQIKDDDGKIVLEVFQLKKYE